jgi:hypothetical protein
MVISDRRMRRKRPIRVLLSCCTRAAVFVFAQNFYTQVN